MKGSLLILPLLGMALVGCKQGGSSEGDQAATKLQAHVLLETTKGTITIHLYKEAAPASAANFLQYVDSGFYDGTIFHRIIPSFMIQGGGFTADLKKKTVLPPVKNESDNGKSNVVGTLAMARTSDPNSATSQFFINVVNNARLDGHQGRPGYTTFGEIVDGLDVVETIRNVTTQCPSKSQPGQPRQPCTAQLPPGMRDVPVEPVVITKAQRIN